MKTPCHIGISGWSYKEWQGRFYPQGLAAGKYLEHYVQHFGTVELNSTFYRSPKPEMMAQWATRVPDGFIFAVKASRYITHIKKLAVEPDSIRKFFDVVEPLDGHLGPIIFQLPPRWKFNGERLCAFLKMLPTGYRYAFELRDQSWLVPEAYAILEKANAAFCIYDLKGFESPWLATADFVYARFHGPREEPYLGEYGAQRMLAWAGKFRGWLQEGREVYCYFDNTMDCSAVSDARILQSMLSERPC